MCDGLPSLHKLARTCGEASAHDDRYDTRFLTLGDVADMQHQSSRGMSSGALLVNFFKFYSEEYDWQQEVVSVRKGSRQTTEAPCFGDLWGRSRKTGLHIEDPIDALSFISALFALQCLLFVWERVEGAFLSDLLVRGISRIEHFQG